jgi:hypothetical protein
MPCLRDVDDALMVAGLTTLQFKCNETTSTLTFWADLPRLANQLPNLRTLRLHDVSGEAGNSIVVATL